MGREGHCNVNAEERWAAYSGIISWIKCGHISPEQEVTVFLPPKPSRVKFDDEKNPAAGGAWGSVHTFDVYGVIFLDFQGSDIDALGIKPNKKVC